MPRLTIPREAATAARRQLCCRRLLLHLSSATLIPTHRCVRR